MHTNNGPFHALSYRQRSARQKKRSQKKDFDKGLVQLHKQRAKLWADRQHLPWIPLAEPYQKGWKRSFVLREDVKRSPNAAFYQALLDKINTTQHNKDKTFSTRKRRQRKYVYTVKEQSLREFTGFEWNSPKLKLTEKEKLFFYRKLNWCPQSKCYTIRYAYTEPWRFVLQVRPHMITEVKMVDAQLEQEIKHLKNYITTHHLEHRIRRLTNGRRGRSWKSYDSTNGKDSHPLKNKPLHIILDACREEEID